jgi:uncharacterized membrane protein
MKLKIYLTTIVIFLGLDAFWLGLVAPRFYQAQIGFLMAKDPIWPAAGIFYLLYPTGLVLFGLIAYATYDLTNLVTIEGWPLLVT